MGYILQRNGSQEGTCEGKSKEGSGGYGNGLENRGEKIKGDWGRRLWLFDALVWSMVGYGVGSKGRKKRRG